MDLAVLCSLLALAGGGVGAYAAVRSDLARLQERTINTQKATEHAHARIDSLMARHST
jgi:hypothetical protein